MKKGKTEYWYWMDIRCFLAKLIQFNTGDYGSVVMDLMIDLGKGIIPVAFESAFHGPFRVKKFPRPCPDAWRIIKKRILARDNYTCAYCGQRGGRLEVDHILPISRGGGHEDENLTAACAPCNRQKHNKTVDEWGGANVKTILLPA